MMRCFILSSREDREEKRREEKIEKRRGAKRREEKRREEKRREEKIEKIEKRREGENVDEKVLLVNLQLVENQTDRFLDVLDARWIFNECLDDLRVQQINESMNQAKDGFQEMKKKEGSNTFEELLKDVDRSDEGAAKRRIFLHFIVH